MSAKRRKAIKRKPYSGPRVNPHVYIPDVTSGATWRGERPCSECPLPKSSRTHIDPPEDNSGRIIGEANEKD